MSHFFFHLRYEHDLHGDLDGLDDAVDNVYGVRKGIDLAPHGAGDDCKDEVEVGEERRQAEQAHVEVAALAVVVLVLEGKLPSEGLCSVG
jgi:hypothetical protein